MGKRSYRRPVQNERDHHGCMWGIISMFDFRQGRTTQRLLSDKRHGRTLVDGSGNAKNKFGLSTKVDEILQNSLPQDEESGIALDAGKLSVKKLIEEEMINEQDIKEEIINCETEGREPNSSKGNKKNSRKKSRWRSKSCDSHLEDLEADPKLEPEQFSLMKLEDKTADMVNIDKIMEEFCHQIHQKCMTCVTCDQHSKVPEKAMERNHDFEETLTGAVKLFINQKFSNSNHGTEDEICSSKGITNVLQNITPDDEMFQGPESVVVKYLQNLYSAQGAKDEFFKLLIQSNLLEHNLHNQQQISEVIHNQQEASKVIQNRQHNFVWQKVKAPHKMSPDEEKAAEVSNQIVILKPGPSLQSPVSEGVFGSLPESAFIDRNKGLNHRVASLFFFTEIKRKLKHAIRKQRQEISTDRTPKKLPVDHLPKIRNDESTKEHVRMNSPSKDHFFIEKKPTMGVKKGDKSGELKGCKSSMDNEAISFPEKNVTGIYIEAKKHLSQMLSDEADQDVFSPSRQVSKTLGKILSLPEFNNSPGGSPGLEGERSFKATDSEFSANSELQNQEEMKTCLGPIMLNVETRPSVYDKSTDDKTLAASSPSDRDEIIYEFSIYETHNCVGNGSASEAAVETAKPTEIVPYRDIEILDSISEPSIENDTGDDQNGVKSETCDEERSPDQLNNELHTEKEPLSSPLTSPSNSSNSKKAEDPEIATEVLERPSPVSVLEPLFMEEEISPANTRSKSVTPLRIQFEELDHLAADQGIDLKSCTDDKVSVLKYVSVVLQSSGVSWEEFCMKLYSSDQLLDPLILDEVEFSPNQLCLEKKLLFDCINEVLIEVFWHYFGCTSGFLSSNRTVRPVPGLRETIYEVCLGVYWYLLPLPVPHNLDQIIKKYLSNSTWMDLRCDADTIAFEIGEVIFSDLLEEAILTSSDAHLKRANPFVAVEFKEEETGSNG